MIVGAAQLPSIQASFGPFAPILGSGDSYCAVLGCVVVDVVVIANQFYQCK